MGSPRKRRRPHLSQIPYCNGLPRAAIFANYRQELPGGGKGGQRNTGHVLCILYLSQVSGPHTLPLGLHNCGTEGKRSDTRYVHFPGTERFLMDDAPLPVKQMGRLPDYPLPSLPLDPHTPQVQASKGETKSDLSSTHTQTYYCKGPCLTRIVSASRWILLWGPPAGARQILIARRLHHRPVAPLPCPYRFASDR